MKTAISILIVLLIICAVIAGVYVYRYNMAKVEGIVGAQEQIQSAPMRISAYNYFFDLYGAIKSYDASLKALNENLAAVSSEGERERILATIAGLKGQKARATQQYNMDAKKSYTVGQFRDWQLPYQIEEGK